MEGVCMNETSKGIGASSAKVLPRLCIVIPCYNEELVLPLTCTLFKDKVDCLVAAGKVAAAVGIGLRC